MRPFPSHKQKPSVWYRHLRWILLGGMALLGIWGCRKSVRTDDPQLRPVQELLDAQVPAGTPEDKVKAVLELRGYKVLPSQRPGTIVAVIPVPENGEIPPATARVTFYFDANGKLNTFSLARASGDPKQ